MGRGRREKILRKRNMSMVFDEYKETMDRVNAAILRQEKAALAEEQKVKRDQKS